MVVNASDIDHSIRFLDDTNIVTSNATIGTSIYQRTRSFGLVQGDRIIDAMGLYLVIFLAIDDNLIAFITRSPCTSQKGWVHS